MKKIITGVLLCLCSFFFFAGESNAAVNFALNYDIHEHFNYFYEQKNNTPFYQFITNNSIEDLKDIFRSYTYIDSDDPFVFGFYYASDIGNFLSVPDSVASNVPDNAYYAVLISELKFTFSDNSGSYYLESDSDNDYHHDSCFIYYDSNANYVSKYCAGVGERFETNLLDINDITYFFSMMYYSTDNLLFIKNPNIDFDIRLTSLITNNESYNIKHLETRNNFLNFFSNLYNYFFNNGNMSSLEDIGLSYFLTNFYVDSSSINIVSLYNIFHNDNIFSYSVPDNYNSSSFSYDNRYYLVPNSLTCSQSESLLYFSTTDLSSVNLISYFVQNDSLNYDFNTYSFSLNYTYTPEILSLNSFVDNISDYVYLIYSSDNFSSNTIYYNPSCFNLYSAVGNGTLEFTNINTGNTVILTPNDKNYLNNLVNNSIKDSINIENDDVDLDLSNILDNAWNGVKSFVNSSYHIVSMSTNLFKTLPLEISSLLTFTFTIGVIILIWKLFH